MRNHKYSNATLPHTKLLFHKQCCTTDVSLCQYPPSGYNNRWRHGGTTRRARFVFEEKIQKPFIKETGTHQISSGGRWCCTAECGGSKTVTPLTQPLCETKSTHRGRSKVCSFPNACMSKKAALGIHQRTAGGEAFSRKTQ